MSVVINRRPTAVKADFSLLQGLKKLFFAAKCVVKSESHACIIEKNSNKFKITIINTLYVVFGVDCS
jgi:hypothetical protein